MESTPLKVAGLFAGVGGIELGFTQAGFQAIVANEIDNFAAVTYRLNHENPLILSDIHALKSSEVPRIDVLTGGFPCQAFSVAGYRKGFSDPRGNVFWEIIRILEDRKPEVIFLENVKNLKNHDGGKTFEVIINALEETGYNIQYKVLNASEYSSIPQNRERIYIVGFRTKKFENKFTFPAKASNRAELSQFIDLNGKVGDEFYYNDKYMTKELVKSIKRIDTVYQ